MRVFILALSITAVLLIWRNAENSVADTQGWPVAVGTRYPDWELRDHEGKQLRLSSFAGKVVILEPVGMPCSACQAFSGGHKTGGMGNVTPQAGLPSMEELIRNYGRFSPDRDDLAVVQVLFFGLNMGVATPEDAKAWRAHFKLDRFPNWHVVVPVDTSLQAASYEHIPGAQLLDRELVLRADSTGRSNRRDDLFRGLMPMAGQMLESK